MPYGTNDLRRVGRGARCAVVYVCLPRAQMTSIFEGKPLKTRPNYVYTWNSKRHENDIYKSTAFGAFLCFGGSLF